MPNPNKINHMNANNQRKTGQPVNILLRLLPFGPDRIGRSNVHPAFLYICMKQSSGFDKFFMAEGWVINAINSEFGLAVMTVMDLPDRCQEHGLRLCCNKSAVLPSHSALPDHQYVPEHPYRIAPARQCQREYRIQAWSD